MSSWFSSVRFVGVLGLSLSLLSCGQTSNSDKLQVAVSILPQAEFVEAVGGDRVNVTVMIPPGANPATYEPSPKQMRALQQAQLYVRVGLLPFERAWMDKILQANPKLIVIDSSEGIPIVDNDPHIWTSPRLVERQVERIYEGLVRVDPEHKAAYERNKNVYLEQLETLDAQIRQILVDLPRREFLVFHPVWGYFARAYGLTQIPIEREGKEPSASALAQLIELARAKGIKAVFVQPQFPKRHAQVIANQIGGRVIVLDPLARHYRENLLHVAQTIARVLQEKQEGK